MKHIIAVIFAFFVVSILTAEIRYGNFQNSGGNPPTQKTIETFRKKGIKCPDAREWPKFWNMIGKNGEVSFPREPDGNRFMRITGPSLLVSGYHGEPLNHNKIAIQVMARGDGVLRIAFLNYAKAGKGLEFRPKGLSSVRFRVRSKSWTTYSFVLDKPDEIYNTHPVFAADEGTVDVDNAVIYSKAEHDDVFALAEAEMKLRRNKKFRTDDALELPLDGSLQPAVEEFRRKTQALRTFAAGNPEHKLAKKLLKKAEILRPYFLTDGVKTIRKDLVNQAAAFCYAVEKITGVVTPETGKKVSVVKQTVPVQKAAVQKKKKTPFRIHGLIIPKRLYLANEKTVLRIGIYNGSGADHKAKLKVRLHSGLNDVRLIHDGECLLKKGNNGFRIPFEVGNELFGRCVEVQFMSQDGKVLASGRDYFQMHPEYMRVMLHGTSRYQNFSHFFAHEQTDFGVQYPKDKRWITSQPLNKTSTKGYYGQVNYHKNAGRITSFYQCRSFSGAVGLEEVRKHPEYILYGANAQPEIDPFYGGTPNPFEIAAPTEIDPELRKEKLNGMKHLDVELSAWHHLVADFTNMKCLKYGAKCVREYKKKANFDVIYLDDTPAVMPGYTWNGTYNIAGLDKKEIAALNAKIARTWNEELRKDNPYAGTWCNGANPSSVRWLRSLGMWEKTMGLGVDVDKGEDVSDEFIKALTSAKNSTCLYELQHIFYPQSKAIHCFPETWKTDLLERRDYLIQKYKTNVIFGYISIPTPSKDLRKVPREYAWATLSHFHALTVATQHHHILYGAVPGVEAMQPFDQFATRYSGLIWDRDLIAMPKAQAVKTVRIKSEKPLDWEDFVYTLKGTDSETMVVHLVRPYPLKKWDLKWNVLTPPLKGVKATVTIPAGRKPVLVKTMRPYDVHEKEEIVEHVVPFEIKGNKITFSVPEFAYYNMIAVQFK